MLYSIFGFVAVADVFVSVAVVANAAALATAAAAIATAAAVGVSFVPMLPSLMSRMLLLMTADCSNPRLAQQKEPGSLGRPGRPTVYPRVPLLVLRS